MAIHSLKGVNDILPEEAVAWAGMERLLAEVFRVYGYLPIRVPVIEESSLFIRSIGEATDIVEKEIYQFSDRGGRTIALRPEATASVVRAYVQHHMQAHGMVKLYYHGPMFRGERPQAGRNRQFHQMGVEAIGSLSPVLDAEVVEMAHRALTQLGVRRFEISLNCVGCSADKRNFAERLRAFLAPREQELCPSCQRRCTRNILRVLDCKNPACRDILSGAPVMTDYLCEACRTHFDHVSNALDQAQVSYCRTPHLVRGLDYYTRTVFEITHSGLGAQNSVCAGGRYDNLVAELGGQPAGAIGFAFGLERLMLAAEAEAIHVPADISPAVYIIGLGQSALPAAMSVARDLRHRGITTLIGYDERSLKAQLKQADKTAAHFALIIGDNELAAHTVVVRNMKQGAQTIHPRDTAVEHISQALRSV